MNITYTLHVLHWYTNFIVLLKTVLHTYYIYITAITYIMFNSITILHVQYYMCVIKHVTKRVICQVTGHVIKLGHM